ncbi:aminopeptidase P family protein [Pelagibacterales bacterium SAG-MED25]|uniref:aminopeptidase P family protein n=1 Tax=Pelagibacter sp. (strain HTCC7211) TaxID=439493 RepID=UPI0002D851D6|nr:aminopeptidase P family protein [Candidatus Pelagibacter sp. HTCC7211]MBD1151656.1 aminopeptidase P family protein [Pelagibacterales bacterium SAG-MED25]
MNKRINLLRKKFKKYNIDGYIVSKNDDYFTEYSKINRLEIISNFTGSAGLAIILKNKNYLFTDGRYTIQSQIESGKDFKIVNYDKIINFDLVKNLTLGIDPKLFTYEQIKKYFLKNNKIKFITKNLIDEIKNKKIKDNFKFFSLKKEIVGESSKSKINKIVKYLKKNKSDYLLVSAPENVAWILNIRGGDGPNSPVPNSRLIISKTKKIFLISKIYKTEKLIKDKIIKSKEVIDVNKFHQEIVKLNGKNFIIDNKSCSIFYEDIIKSKFRIVKREDPTYLLKSVKNKIEINNTINSHIIDGVALTKFIYWIKNINKKKITEVEAQNKLEKFRKMNENYLYPSFDTIAGSGENGAIVHYRAKKENCRTINKTDIFLCDSGGQYKYGTTDVTRTICFSKPKSQIKDIFTKVLKGHIAVANTDLKKDNTGKKIDARARKFLNKSNLDYAHGTGHGVGFFLNVHEGPQAITKINSIKIKEGMILSNEPGYYQKGKFGIRIENLVFVKKDKNKIFFENLTLAPIEKDLINYKLLSSEEKNYLFKYHLNVYSKISKFLNANERRWLASYV